MMLRTVFVPQLMPARDGRAASLRSVYFFCVLAFRLDPPSDPTMLVTFAVPMAHTLTRVQIRDGRTVGGLA